MSYSRRVGPPPPREGLVLAWCSFFGTSIGLCGIAWTDRGICGVQLPESNDAVTRERLKRRFSDAAELEPPPDIQSVIDDVVARGRAARPVGGRARRARRARFQPSRVCRGPLDRAGRRCRRRLRPTPREAGVARAVGQALGQNPYPIIVPCHRVLAAGGRAGGPRPAAASTPSSGCSGSSAADSLRTHLSADRLVEHAGPAGSRTVRIRPALVHFVRQLSSAAPGIAANSTITRLSSLDSPAIPQENSSRRGRSTTR